MAVAVLSSISTDVQTGKFKALLTADATPSASSVFCGFKPRIVTVQQVSGTPDATWSSLWVEGMTAAYRLAVGNTGAGTIVTSTGITVLDGTEAAPAAKATNSPASSGAGFTIGTGCQATSLVYFVTAER